jgi:TRAP-type C4-dicarboxylate transport system substrate-binding protein
MKRIFVATIALAICAQGAQAEQIIRISHQWAAQKDIRDRAVRLFAEEIRKQDKGFQFRFFPSNSLISDPHQQFEELQRGNLEMSVFPPMLATGKVPEFAIATMPGAIPGPAVLPKLKGSKFYALFQAIAEKNGMHILGWWWGDASAIASKTRSVLRPADTAGLKIRSPSKYADLVFKELGVPVVYTASSEVYSVLQTGIVNTANSSCESFGSFRIYEQTKHVTVSSEYAPLGMSLNALVISMKTWNTLTPAQKEIFQAAADKAGEMIAAHERSACENLATLARQKGNTIGEFSRADYESWQDIIRKTAWAQYVKDAPQGAALLEALKEVQ